MNIRNFVFGYGSLISRDSRARTISSLGEQSGLAVLIRNVERVWSARVFSRGFTAMGICKKPGSVCSGVLLEVNDKELSYLDAREANYDRVMIPLYDVQKVSSLEEGGYYHIRENRAHPIFGSNEGYEQLKVWMYVQKDHIEADESHPIPQSYLDIMIRGCLEIDEDFARSFISTTVGWDQAEGCTAYWVDDRSNPIYERADPVYSAEYSDVIDKLLMEEQCHAFNRRIAYQIQHHLNALESEILANKATRKGFHFIQSRR